MSLHMCRFEVFLRPHSYAISDLPVVCVLLTCMCLFSHGLIAWPGLPGLPVCVCPVFRITLNIQDVMLKLDSSVNHGIMLADCVRSGCPRFIVFLA